MKNLAFILFFTTVFAPIFGQETMKIAHSCSYDGEESNLTLYVDEPSKKANDIVAKIMKANVLNANFIVKSADCKNALATTEGGKRYILYNTTFLENLKSKANTVWACYSVLAHEIGHHLNYDDLAETDEKKRRIFELQADKYAGGILYQMGATLEQAQAGINTFSLEGETKTHPPKQARLNAVANGWKQAQENRPQMDEETPNDEDKPAPKPVKKDPPKPSVEPTKPVAQPNFTEVSDNILQRNVVGTWYSNANNVEVLIKIYDNGQWEAASTANGQITSGSVGTWAISSGYYYETITMVNFIAQNQTVSYKITFNGNYMTLYPTNNPNLTLNFVRM